MMDWRTWVYNKLVGASAITDLVEDRIFSSEGMAPEKRPFIVIRVGNTDSQLHSFEGAEATVADIWIHDDPEGYTVVDDLLLKVRAALESDRVTNPGAISAIWQGDSPDLADDIRGTVVRTSAYRLVGRR